MKVFTAIYLEKKLFVCQGIFAFLFVFAYFFPLLFVPAIVLYFILWGFIIIDIIWLFYKKQSITAERISPNYFSLSDYNKVLINIENHDKRSFFIEVIDEPPFQFQMRDFSVKLKLNALENKSIDYSLNPKTRGEYEFNNINLFVKTKIGIIKRRIIIEQNQTVKVYPSIQQMKKMELFTFSKISKNYGIKKQKHKGLSYEFEQLKEYSVGDDIRHLNWKASARNTTLMINQFIDEKSQSIYNIIDKSRSMLMPFNELSLMDYAINSALVISNIGLKKHDRIGLITYSDVIGNIIKADNKNGQLRLILETLYKQKERYTEANNELLYFSVKRVISNRSLIFYYTNFESISAVKRSLPFLLKIKKLHLLVVIIFENENIKNLSERTANSIEEVYTQILAEQAVNEKQLIVNELNSMGIQTILTQPENLNINVINKYLEIKSRGMI